MARILIIDDDTFICQALQKQLQNKGYKAEVAFSGNSGLKKLRTEKFDLILCDFRLPDKDGLQILQEMQKLEIDTPFVVITAYADVRMAVKLMKMGAFDYLTKPLQTDEIIPLLEKSGKKSSKKESKAFPENDFVKGKDKSYNTALSYAEKVAPTDMSVLIEGETGTGKEYIARYIHQHSERSNQPFLAVDCGAIPKELATSVLFGHVKGSFTGAIKNKTGVFQQANGGTLFLDEIGNLTYNVQVQLLRALQEKVVTRVGENKSTQVDVRVIAATNETLNTPDNDSSFRGDLLHRINEFKINLPPLRDRKTDILLFARHFTDLANRELGREVTGFSDETARILEYYPWPGNIRELKNVIKRAVLLTVGDVIQPETLPVEIVELAKRKEYAGSYETTGENHLSISSSEAEKQTIIEAIIKAGYNKSKAARNLNIDRKTLYNKIKKLGIEI